MQILVDEHGCRAVLIKNWVKPEQAASLLAYCQTLHTEKYDFKWYGRSLKQTRMNYACGDPGVYHTFGGVDVPIHEWNSEFKEIRDRINQEIGVYNNFCLVNHYRDGNDSIAPHSDGELNALYKSVFTLSLGCTRIMKLIHKLTGRTITFEVCAGDLFIMCGDQFQDQWKHGIDPDPLVMDARYSLTLRGANTR